MQFRIEPICLTLYVYGSKTFTYDIGHSIALTAYLVRNAYENV